VKGGIEECIYGTSLVEGPSILLVIPDNDVLASVFSILRMALPRDRWPTICQLNGKSSAQQSKKVMKELKKDLVLVVDPRSLSHLDFNKIAFKTVLVIPGEFQSSWIGHVSKASAQASKLIYFVSPNQRANNTSIMSMKEYKLENHLFSLSVSRVAVARKIYLLQQCPLPGNPSGASAQAALDSRVAKERALRERLKVLLNMPIISSLSIAHGVVPISGSVKVAPTKESGKTMRKKMVILGMIQETTNANG
jgi:hypothetical protein